MAILRLGLRGALMVGLAIPVLLVVTALVLVVVIALQRSMNKGNDRGNGADIISYLVLALSMGVVGFALAELANTAFPGDRFVFDPAQNLSTSLSLLVVSVPFLVYFWIRQARRRVTYPRTPGWTLYLSIIEVVFMSAFVFSAVTFIDRLLGGDSASAWVNTVIFGLIVLFHEVAAERTPPLSDGGDIRRVVGSAIGLIVGSVGLAGTLSAVFAVPLSSFDLSIHPWLAMLIIGGLVWAFRWLRTWPEQPSVIRLIWGVAVTTGSLVTAIASATTIAVLVLQYLLAETGPAVDHFKPAVIALGTFVAMIMVWLAHRPSLSLGNVNARLSYLYITAATGLVASVISVTGLTIGVFGSSLIVGRRSETLIGYATTLVVGLVVWRLASTLADRMVVQTDVIPWPRRFYHLGLGVAFALVSTGSLTTILFIVLRRLLDGGSSARLLEPASIFVYTGLAAWYLLAIYAGERVKDETTATLAPFEVTLVTSHPGMIAARFPDAARLKVIYRGDDVGPIDDDMADAIVAAVDNKPSLVWVDEDGFRVAPKQVSS